MLKSLKWALAELLGHNQEIAALSAQIEQRDKRIAELEAKAIRAEQTAHKFTEEARYSLETAAEVIEKADAARGEQLAAIAFALPYVFAGRRSLNDPLCSRTSGEARARAVKVARQYGIELPDDPVHAVRCLLRLSITVLKPELSLPVEHMRGAWPVKEA
jgi:septal ring factor EnvC (AmiA/AmiB activator)